MSWRWPFYPAPQQEYVTPPDAFGLQTVYPIVTNAPGAALWREVRTDLAQAVALGWYADDPYYSQHFGEVWTHQLDISLGYYVAPEVLQEIGLTEWLTGQEIPPNA